MRTELPQKHWLRRESLLFPLLLAGLTLFSFWPVLFCEFVVYDDPVFVTQNPRVLTGLSWENLRWAFTTHYPDFWRPLSWISHMLDCQIGGLRPWLHHLTSLCLHLLSALLLYSFVRQMTGFAGRAFVVAALFALHPLHVESVAWIAERKDVLSGLFAMASLLFYQKYARHLARSNYYWALCFFAMSLMSKPAAVTLPCVFLLLDYWPLQRLGVGNSGLPPGNIRFRPGRLVLEKAPFFILSILSSVLAVMGQQKMAAVISLDFVPLYQRLINAPVAYFQYFEKTVWPARLSVFYPRTDSWSWMIIVSALIFLAGVSSWAWRMRKSQPWLLVGWLWYLGMLFPMIGLVQVGDQAMADRYTYLPLIGVFLMVVWAVCDFWRHRPKTQKLLPVLGVILILACAFLTRHQLRFWQNSFALFAHARAVTPANYLATTVLGSLLTEKGQYDEAILLFREALRWRPDFSDAHLHWGVALEKQGKLDEAFHHFSEAIRIKPNYENAYHSLGLLQAKQGNHREAIKNYRELLKLNPDSVEGHNNLGIALQASGQLNEAVQEYKTALRLNPAQHQTHQNLALALHAQGNYQDAIQYYRLALEQQPRSANLHLKFGSVLAAMGAVETALSHLDQALQLQPDSVGILNQVGWLKATHPDPRMRNATQALQLAQRACTLTHDQDPASLNTLAAAFAEAGRFPEAVQTQQKAIDQVKPGSNPNIVAGMQELLSLYQTEKPFRYSGF